jgi:hypothetical protein
MTGDTSITKYATRETVKLAFSQSPYVFSTYNFGEALSEAGVHPNKHMDYYYRLDAWARSLNGARAASDMVEDLYEIWSPERTQAYFEEAARLYSEDATVQYDPYYSLAIYWLEAYNRNTGKPYWPMYRNIGIVTRKFKRGRCTNPDLLEQFNQTVKVSLLDRKIMPEFNHAFTSDMNLDSGQYADLAAFAFKLGNYFRNLK